MCNSINNCGICLNDIGCKRTITLKCNHSFCISCIFKWLNIKKSCPLCRDNVDVNEVKKLNGMRVKVVNEVVKVNNIHIIRINHYRVKNNSNLTNEEISLIIIKEDKELREFFNKKLTFMDIVNHIGDIGYSFFSIIGDTIINGSRNSESYNNRWNNN